MVAILGYTREQIRSAVRDMYTAVARAPGQPFHFPVGRQAGAALDYPDEQLDQLPQAVLSSFAGVGYPFRGGAIRPGDTCLDVGAGAGNDSLIASRLVGRSGSVFALDLTPAMTRKLLSTAEAAGADNITVIEGSAEALPLPDESVDSITSNGALNLVPDKRRAIREMFRVLRPGGRLQMADVVIQRPVMVDCDSDPRLWVECVVGATVEEELLDMFRDAGFGQVQVIGRHDYFSLSPSAQTREIARSFNACSIEVVMRRGAETPGRFRQYLRRLNPRRVAASLWRRGWMGVAGLGLALLACYGLLAAIGLLAVLGAGLAFNETIWTGAIAVFTILAAACVAPGMRQHGSLWPTGLAVAGTGLVLYALFVDYRWLVELGGFLLLAGAVGGDIILRRRQQSRVLGLDEQQPAG